MVYARRVSLEAGVLSPAPMLLLLALLLNPPPAGRAFQEAQTVCSRDAGALWGVSLCGPMLLVDPETRQAVANRPDAEKRLKESDGVWTGTLPREVILANTAANWAGAKWTMLMLPLPEQKQARVRLLMHELFHRVQADLGLAGGNPSNAHLGTRDGRIWLQAEWRALETALRESGSRQTAIEDALVFRAWRRSLFPAAAGGENQLEIGEGLAEYTGVKLSTSTRNELAVVAACGLLQGASRPAFERSFAYVSGPAYGALLDDSGLAWKAALKRTPDLGALLAEAYTLKLPPPSRAEAEKRLAAYDGADLVELETRRDAERREQSARYRRQFVEQPVLVLPLTSKVNYGFNPNNAVALDENSTVFPAFRVVDEWGILEATAGLLVRESGRAVRAQVPAPAGGRLEGPGWKLTLNEGWELVPGVRAGDVTIKKTR